VLTELHEKGLIEKILLIPTEYKALPIEEAANLLIDRKKKEICDIEKQATKLLKKLKEELKNNLPTEAQFILLPEKGKYIERTLKLIRNSKTGLDVLTTPERFRVLDPFLYEELKKALSRGVKVRLLVRKPWKEHPQLSIPKNLRQNPLFHLRLGNEPSDTIMSMVDNQEANIVTSERKNLDESTTLWTNNQAIIRIIQSYFEKLWETSTALYQQEKQR
jgi:sugar-specific transcriptional regulator TrmB